MVRLVWWIVLTFWHNLLTLFSGSGMKKTRCVRRAPTEDCSKDLPTQLVTVTRSVAQKVSHPVNQS
jgi:hypothetical protein